MKDVIACKETYAEEYKLLQEERIKKDRIGQKGALKCVHECIAVSIEHEPGKKLVSNQRK